jgi:glycosyltransferase involved in cell wall biosynthesis
MTLSVCIICRNEEKNIRRCIESATWADEIIVVDAMSQDKTVEIAREYTDKLYQNVWPGYVDQKNFAISKANGKWILSVDADEEITATLRDEILGEIQKDDAKDGYRIPRRSFYQGRWINHSGYYPDRQLRLFIQGSIGNLKKDLLHYPYKGVISGQLQTVNSFSSLMAEDMYERGKRYHISLLFLRPIFKFFEVYLFKLGFFDGLAGFIIAVTSAYAMFVRYVKLRELEPSFEKKKFL